MLSKKLVLIALSAVLLSACQAIGSGEDSASNINRVRGKRGMTISDAEARQQRRQRVSELEESATRHTRTRINMETTRDGIGTVRDGINLIQQIRSIF